MVEGCALMTSADPSFVLRPLAVVRRKRVAGRRIHVQVFALGKPVLRSSACRFIRVARSGPALGHIFHNRSATVAALVGAVLVCGAARAEVIEIGAGGSVTVYDRPAVFGPEGAQPLPFAAPARRKLAVRARAHRGWKRAGAAGASSGGSGRDALVQAADLAALSPDLVEAVAWQESRLQPGRISRAGAIGEMQLMPATARALGVDPTDSRQNYRGGAAYLSQLLRRYDGDTIRALAAYDAGVAAVDRYGGTPPYKETQAYVAAILDRLSRRAEQTDR